MQRRIDVSSKELRLDFLIEVSVRELWDASSPWTWSMCTVHASLQQLIAHCLVSSSAYTRVEDES